MAHPNAQLLTQFYEAFARRDHATMGQCYADTASFGDPVFDKLDAAGARAMWRMLCEAGKDLEITYRDVQADDQQGSCVWEARYSFSLTGRKVHNIIHAHFAFSGGKIVAHVDHFDFYRWARQALGLPGWLLGWSDMLRHKVSAQAMRRLASYRSKNNL